MRTPQGDFHSFESPPAQCTCNSTEVRFLQGVRPRLELEAHKVAMEDYLYQQARETLVQLGLQEAEALAGQGILAGPDLVVVMVVTREKLEQCLALATRLVGKVARVVVRLSPGSALPAELEVAVVVAATESRVQQLQERPDRTE